MIALKPSFLLDQLEKTRQPVVFLDVDLEFHKFPDLFLYDSWPDGPRDVALFNFWANETNLTYRHTPNIGSAVAYFNQTYRAKKLLAAWAEAMKYGTNAQRARRPGARHAAQRRRLDVARLARLAARLLPAADARLLPRRGPRHRPRPQQPTGPERSLHSQAGPATDPLGRASGG